ncbi:hypothetical protein EC991_009953 [Linnemannia zychae]|nr:hypothetical protein EC991_009953 [Linnemannia zychae]
MTNHHTEASERQPLIDRYTRIPRPEDDEDGLSIATAAIKPNEDIPQDEVSRLAALQALPWHKRPSIGWLLPFVFLLALVLGISQAPQEQLIIKIICKEYFRERETRSEEGGAMLLLNQSFITNEFLTPHDDPCNSPPVVALAALVLGRVRALKYISGFFTIGYLTSLSDRYGRKPLIYMTLVPATLTQLLIVYMARPSSNLGIGVLYADGLFMGLMGAGILLEPCLNAYVADCTPREGRSLSIGYVMVSLAVGMTVGPLLSAFLHNLTHDYNVAMFISAGTLFFLMFYAAVLPESLPRHARVVVAAKSAVNELTAASPAERVWATMKSSMLTILDPILLFVPGRIEAAPDVNVSPSPYTLLLLLVGYGIGQFASNGMTLILIPYTNLVFGWTGVEDGYYLGLSGAATFVVYLVIFPLLHRFYKELYGTKVVAIENTEQDEYLERQQGEADSAAPLVVESRPSLWGDLFFYIFGSVVYVIAYFTVALFRTQSSLVVACILRALASIAVPSFTSLLTSFVPTHQTGKALGGVSVMDTLVMTLSSFLYGWVLAKTSATMPSAVFIMSGACACLSVLVGLIVWVTFKRAEKRG